jgi:uncharacterized protein YneF (UPF0154 family)
MCTFVLGIIVGFFLTLHLLGKKIKWTDWR